MHENKKYNKLVRDNIPDIIESLGKKVKYRIIINNEDYRKKLFEKLQEEIDEFKSSGKSEEIADILEVIDYIIKDYSLDRNAIEYEKREKKRSRGGFDSKILLEEVKNG
jgi:predicted house-cleaning noncanonical NTP pyrophosphatase (MazG superfamily)